MVTTSTFTSLQRTHTPSARQRALTVDVKAEDDSDGVGGGRREMLEVRVKGTTSCIYVRSKRGAGYQIQLYICLCLSQAHSPRAHKAGIVYSQ